MASFELEGLPGAVAVRGVGILFLMWQVPGIFALIAPIKHRTALIEALIMQGVGLLGESILAITLPPGHALLLNSLRRFILFDGIGFLILGAALWLVTSLKISDNKHMED